ncbi:hypothetical protein [Methanolacinia paynteri]|uniref:hypothetical protein n=1 Tax=Methanolacinia paynteri TaxID=230356 RepID=UPI00064E631E|nr:hypothetical protein [Methanolacinia paynteri]
MDDEYPENLVSVGRRLRDELNKCGEHVTPSTRIDPVEGRIWKKFPSGNLREITVDSKKVLLAVENYRNLVESTRKKCSESRKERI